MSEIYGCAAGPKGCLWIGGYRRYKFTQPSKSLSFHEGMIFAGF